MLENFIRIEHENCTIDGDYTICPFKELPSMIKDYEGDFELETVEAVKAGQGIKITITPLPGFTEEDYDKWIGGLDK